MPSGLTSAHLDQGGQMSALNALLIRFTGLLTLLELGLDREFLPLDLESSQGRVPWQHRDIEGFHGLVALALESVGDFEHPTNRVDPAGQLEVLHGQRDGLSCDGVD
jgi:hypothetical protein